MDYDWLPASDGQFILWFNTFREGIAKYSGSLDLTTEEVMEVDAEYKAYAYMLAQINALRAEVQTREEYKNMLRDGPESASSLPFPSGIVFAEHPDVPVRPGIVPRLVRMVSRIKSSSSYSTNMGIELGIEGGEVERVPTAPENIVPVTDHGMVHLEFTKSLWQGVQVESQRADETHWTLLGTLYQSPFVDARPPLVPNHAEVRRYRLRYVDSTQVIGGYSPIVQVVLPARAASEAPMVQATLR